MRQNSAFTVFKLVLPVKKCIFYIILVIPSAKRCDFWQGTPPTLLLPVFSFTTPHARADRRSGRRSNSPSASPNRARFPNRLFVHTELDPSSPGWPTGERALPARAIAFCSCVWSRISTLLAILCVSQKIVANLRWIGSLNFENEVSGQCYSKF